MPVRRSKIKDQPKSGGNEVVKLNVQQVTLSSLKPHPKNPRKHPVPGTPDWDRLKKSLEHDYFDPLVWNKRNKKLVSGHLRAKVLREMGVKEVDVVVVDYDEPTHLARMIAANKSIGDDDFTKLGEVFFELGTIDDFDLELSGFTLAEINELTPQQGGDSHQEDTESPPSDDAPVYTEEELTRLFGAAAGDKPTVEVLPGDVWRVNANYLVCCDVVREVDKFLPLFDKLKKEFPKRKILFIPIPDPLMVGVVDPRVACVMVQPSALAASWALTLLKARKKSSTIKKITA
jgi:hypothetical protein